MAVPIALSVLLPAVLPGTLLVAGDTLFVEILTTEQERALGLMFRTELPENHGALFVFPRPQRLSFWMKNTYIPLDLAFLDASGVIVELHALKPLDEHPVTSSTPVPFALEVNRGYFARRGVGVGDTIRLPAWLTAPYEEGPGGTVGGAHEWWR